MVNAGRILIIPKGQWSNLVSYDMLDLVTEGSIAYIARQASVGVNPSTDTSMTYWQTFGSAAEIATTTAPGIVMPDGVTITVDATGLIKANIGIADITDIDIQNPSNKDVIRYNSTSQKWENVALGTAATKNSTNAVAQSSTDVVESGAVYTEVNALSTKIGNLNSLGTTDKTSTVAAINEVNTNKANTTDVTNKHKVTRFSVATSGWTADTSSQSGTTLYKKSIALSHVYVPSPSVDIGATGVLPTTAQQEAYDLLQYATVNGTTLYLYASAIPTTAFYINVEGVD